MVAVEEIGEMVKAK